MSAFEGEDENIAPTQEEPTEEPQDQAPQDPSEADEELTVPAPEPQPTTNTQADAMAEGSELLEKSTKEKPFNAPKVLGGALTGYPAQTEAEAEKSSKPTMMQLIQDAEFKQQLTDPFLAWSAHSRGEAALSDLQHKGTMLTQDQYKNSPYFRPGVAENYPKGLSTEQAKEIMHRMDMVQFGDQQAAMVPAYKRITADAAASAVNLFNDPKSMAMIFTTEGVGVAARALPQVAGTIASVEAKYPALANFLDSTFVGKGLKAAARGGTDMAVLTAAPAAQYATQGSLPHPENALPSPYGYIDAVKDTVASVPYGAAMGVGGYALGSGIKAMGSALKTEKPSEILKNTTSSEEYKQTAQDIVSEAHEATKNGPGPVPEDLLAKYPTAESAKEPQATPEQLKAAHLEGSEKDLPAPSQAPTFSQSEYKKQLELWAKDNGVSVNDAIDHAYSKTDLQKTVAEHNGKFEGFPSEGEGLDIKSLPDDLNQSRYRTNKYLQSENALPYVADALRYLKNPDQATTIEKQAYESIKNGDESALLDAYIKRAQEDPASDQKTLTALEKRKAILDKHKDLHSSLDNVNDKLQTYLKTSEQISAKKSQPYIGKSLMPRNIAQAMVTKAQVDTLANRPVEVRGLFKTGLSESPLLKSSKVPEGFEDLKDHANNLIPTTEDYKSDFHYPEKESEYPIDETDEKPLKDVEENIDELVENLSDEDKLALADEEHMIDEREKTSTGLVKGIMDCLLGGE